jgi:hypothetical protein
MSKTMTRCVILALMIGAISALPREDRWAEVEATADPGGQPSDLVHGCGTQGKCSSDVFCPAMPKFNIEEKTKLDCIWGTSETPDNAASSMSAEGSIAKVYEDTGECEYSVYGNPCAWKKTMEYCESLRGKPLVCPWYCNKEELYCAARYLNSDYDWEDKPDIVPTGKCEKTDQSQCCTVQLDERYDAKCDPMNWNFKANAAKIKHCRAHAFSRSCNYYYDNALKLHEAKYNSAAGQAATDENCKKSLATHSCSPFKEPYLGEAFCKMACGDGTISERDGQTGATESYGNDNGCCTTYEKLLKEKAEKDAADKAKTDAAVNGGSCKDEESALKADWGAEYTCAYNKEAGYCEYGFVEDMKKWCAATCRLCGTELPVVVTPERLEASAKSMQLVAKRMRAKKTTKLTLVQKYLRMGYPDLPELNRA